MKKELAKLELEKCLMTDAAELVAARMKSKIIHGTKDTRAAGDEVEKVVRKSFSRKLPDRFYVGDGHIVDENLVTSPQLDIIISDKQNAPVLFKGENGTKYFTY